MANSGSYVVALVLAVCCLMTSTRASAPQNIEGQPTYAALKAANLTGQWNITLKTGLVANPHSTYTAIHCNYTDFTNKSSCLFPVHKTGNGQAVLVSYFLKNVTKGLKVAKGLTPHSVQIKMCFSIFSYTSPTGLVDRPWRKKNRPYPALDINNCKWVINNTPIAAILGSAGHNGSAVVDFDHISDVGTASMWFMLRVMCVNGTRMDTCAYDKTELSNYIGTEVNMGITYNMVWSSILLAAVGPVMLISYALADRSYYRRTGKPLTFFTQ